MVMLLAAGMAMAGNGHGQGNQGSGSGDGSGLASLIPDSETFVVSGVVEAVSYRGGITVSGDDRETYIFAGVGPYYYWESVGVERPVVGDTVVVTYCTVELDGTEVDVALSITVNDGEEVLLRDPETGMPLWRGLQAQGPMRGPADTI